MGGIQSVTLGDEEARMRGCQKSILERKAPATFPTLVEMRTRANWVAHNVEESVDALLQALSPPSLHAPCPGAQGSRGGDAVDRQAATGCGARVRALGSLPFQGGEST